MVRRDKANSDVCSAPTTRCRCRRKHWRHDDQRRNQTQTIDSFADEAAVARIYGGMHVRHSLDDGSRRGKKVGNWVIDHYPLPH
jgi:hypothetical protein